MSGVVRQSAAVTVGALDVQWIHGSPSSKHNTDPDLQVHWYDANTVILRQNKAIDYEAPFMFLLFGDERAVLLDTGATASPDFFPLRRIVDELIESWLDRNPRSDYELLILHTHAHDDHVAGDGHSPTGPTPFSCQPTGTRHGRTSGFQPMPGQSDRSTSVVASCRHSRRQGITRPR